jgi:hypothetical protein
MIPIKQAVWRGHRRRFSALDHMGSLLFSGRYHQAADDFPVDQTWPALYTAVGLHVALGEIQRNTGGSELNDYRFTELWVELAAALDCHDLDAMGLQLIDLIGEDSYDVPRGIAFAAMQTGMEAILVPSATRLGDNLILFPDRLRLDSVLVEVRSVDPNLEKPRR